MEKIKIAEANRKAWLERLKPNDFVCSKQIDPMTQEVSYKFYKIAKITPTGRIRLTQGYLLNHNGEYLGGVGYGHFSIFIQPITKEIREFEYNREVRNTLKIEVKKKLDNLQVLNLEVSQLKELNELLEKLEGE